MIRSFIWYLLKLRFVVVLSSLAAFGGGANVVTAHETLPTIADLEVEEEHIVFTMSANFEAFLAGINLDEVTDTDEAEQAEDYDALRALPASEIEARLPALIDRFNAVPLITVDGEPVVLEIEVFQMPQIDDDELPRVSELVLIAPIEPGADVVAVTWPLGRGTLVLRQIGVDEPFTGYIDPGTSSDDISLSGGGQLTGWQTFVAYIPVGFDHILPQGLDHILFVLGLFFLSTQVSALLWQVSAFTLAHTVTLALGALGWVTIPGSIVEPLIAASIVYVAVENIFVSGLSRWRPLVIFGFGLLHGLGFASVLGEFGLPEGQFIPALIAFNIGVELGQLTVIAMALIVLWLAVRAAGFAKLNEAEMPVQTRAVMARAVSITGSLLIAIIASYWVIERTLL
jgi:hypothetical protein